MFNKPYTIHNAMNQMENRRTLFTIQFGAITRWIKDISIIVLVWKIIGIMP